MVSSLLHKSQNTAIMACRRSFFVAAQNSLIKRSAVNLSGGGAGGGIAFDGRPDSNGMITNNNNISTTKRTISSYASSWRSTTVQSSVSSDPFYQPSNIVGNKVSKNRRCFSSTQEDLHSILEREYAEEMENESTDMPQELDDLKKTIEKDWKVVEGGAVTKLFRTVEGGGKVQISFHCQDTVEVLNENDYVDDAIDAAGNVVGTNEGDVEEPAMPVRFTVTVTKAGKTMVFTCISEDAVAKIQGVAIAITDATTTPETIHANNGVAAQQYQGPEFIELAEDLQEAFRVYLEDDIGINEDMASFIAMYTDYNEQKQYVQFLQDAKSLLK